MARSPESSQPDDEMFTIAFNEKIWRGLPEGQRFTSDHTTCSVTRRSIDLRRARGQTALFDAIDAGLTQLDEGARSRKVLIVVSDGGDNASRTTCQEVLDAALRTDVVIYTVGISDPDDDDADPKLLRQSCSDLAAATGGEAFFRKSVADVTASARADRPRHPQQLHASATCRRSSGPMPASKQHPCRRPSSPRRPQAGRPRQVSLRAGHSAIRSIATNGMRSGALRHRARFLFAIAVVAVMPGMRRSRSTPGGEQAALSHELERDRRRELEIARAPMQPGA